MTEDQIKHMVNRFLMWRLPEGFRPDAGISFKPDYNEGTPWPMKHEPVGTNLFDATQTDAMVRYMIDGLPAALAAESKLARLEADVREYFAAQRDNRGSATDAMRMMDARKALSVSENRE